MLSVGETAASRAARDATPDTATLVATLGDPEQRREGSKALAARLGAEDLLLFALDPMLGRLLAAPELPQTLPAGRRWRAFVEECGRSALGGAGTIHTTELPYPDDATVAPVTALAAADGTVLALIGGSVDRVRLVELRHVLPLLGGVVRSEWRALAAAGRAELAEAGESRARVLAESLDAARRELEAALVRARAAEETAARRARELEAVAEENARLHREAQAAVRLRDAVLSAAAHDLKTPLASTKGYAQLLRRQVSRGLAQPEALQRGLEQIEVSADRMVAMVDDLVDLARLQAGEPLALKRAPMDLLALVGEVVTALRAAHAGRTLRLEAEVEALLGEWDANRLSRVLDNLLSNALKYSPESGEVVVTVRREEDGGGDNGWAVVEVRDPGIGIPAADLPRIFTRFHRASNVPDDTEGTGIGLASAKQIVEQHGGTLGVTSREGEGACFTVRLPCAASG